MNEPISVARSTSLEDVYWPLAATSSGGRAAGNVPTVAIEFRRQDLTAEKCARIWITGQDVTEGHVHRVVQVADTLLEFLPLVLTDDILEVH